MSLSSAVLAGGAAASNAVLSSLSNSPAFTALSASEGAAITQRDDEDGAMLSTGISKSLASGVLSPDDKSSDDYARVEVDGKTPAEVSSIIMDKTPTSQTSGRVIVVVGLSGVGKGTTVSTLKTSLASTRDDKNADRVLCWSNGNIFRALTMLTSLHIEQNSITADLSSVIAGDGSVELKKTLLSMLSFEINPDTTEYDTRITGYGVDYWIKSIENTILKGPLVSGKIPTVASQTQGEVVKFVSDAIVKLTVNAGYDVIVEGRAETVDYIKSPTRFELVMKDTSVIGARRAAQRVAGEYSKRHTEQSDDDCKAALEEIVKELK
jgi:hypothetical protein